MLESDRIIHTSQDENKEFFSLLTYICVDNIAFPPAFIYKGDFRLLQDIWLED